MATRLRSITLTFGARSYTGTTQGTINTVPWLRLVPMPEPPDGSNDARWREYMAVASLDLASRVIGGDELALDVLSERYTNLLRRWARHRMALPTTGQLGDPQGDATNALVRRTTAARLARLRRREIPREGSLLLLLRDALADELQSSRGRPVALDATIGRQRTESYERALKRLEQVEREAVVCVLEFQHGFRQLQRDLGDLSEDSARATYASAVVRLSKEMEHGR